MFLLYFYLWGGFSIGSLMLGVFLLVVAVRLLLGWRPRPRRDNALPLVVTLTGASLFGFAYGTWMWFSFTPDEPNRGIGAGPPLVFGALTIIAAVGIAVASAANPLTNRAPE